MGALGRILATVVLLGCGRTTPSTTSGAEAAGGRNDATPSSMASSKPMASAIVDYHAACASCPHTCCSDGQGGFECSKSDPNDCQVYMTHTGRADQRPAQCWCTSMDAVYDGGGFQDKGTCPVFRGCRDARGFCFDLVDRCVDGKIVRADGGN